LKSPVSSTCFLVIKYEQVHCSNGFCEFDSHSTTKIYKIMKEIILKIDEDNDIYEMIVNGKVYTLDNVYESEYSQLFDELNMSIECV